MRRSSLALVALLAIVPWHAAGAERPWEARVNLPVPVPVELPVLPPTNPFATPVDSHPTILTSPLVERLDSVFRSTAALYVDSGGAVRRAVLLAVPLPGIGDELRQALLETTFTPGRSLSGPASTWLDVGMDLEGRIDRAKVLGVRALPPEPGVVPVPESDPPLAVEPRDGQLPATPVESLEQLPVPKSFRARVASRSWRQEFRLLAEVSPEGRCTRVVFLSCPVGLRRFFLASLSGWTFRPAQAGGAPVSSWVRLEGALEVEVGSLRANALRVTRASSYPRR